MNPPGYAVALAPQETPDWDPADYVGEVYSSFPATMRLDAFIDAAPDVAPPPAVGGWNNADDNSDEYFQVVDDFPKSQVWEQDHWLADESGAGDRVPTPPLPILSSAAALDYTTPGELAALDKRPRRHWFVSGHESWWQDPTIDGRHVIFPRVPYPLGDGPMAPQVAQVSVRAVVPKPLTSVAAPVTGTGGEDYSGFGI